MASTPRTIESVSTQELYDRWAKYYDTDGNILQAIDDVEVPVLLQELFSGLRSYIGNPSAGPRIKITELGCGTGRNTSKLLRPPFSSQIAEIHALDLSAGMLAIARQACLPPSPGTAEVSTLPNVCFQQFNALNEEQKLPVGVHDSDAVVCTLVLEHLPLATFFSTVKQMLRKGGYLLLTNMHEQMGRSSQAGFKDGEGGVKVRGESYVYGVEDVVREAGKWGFVVVGEVRERGVGEEDLEVIGERGRKWVGCQVWFGGLFRYGDC